MQVLDHLGLGEGKRDHMIEVWNKADLLDPLDHASLEAAAMPPGRLCAGLGHRWLWHRTRLLAMLEARLGGSADQYEVTLEVRLTARAWPGSMNGPKCFRAGT